MNCSLCGKVAGFRRKTCQKCQAEYNSLVYEIVKSVRSNAKASTREVVSVEQSKEVCGHVGGIIRRDCKSCRAAYMRAWRSRGIRIAL